MTGRDEDTTAPTKEDVTSDPAQDDVEGSDWTGEGGATPAGPATDPAAG